MNTIRVNAVRVKIMYFERARIVKIEFNDSESKNFEDESKMTIETLRYNNRNQRSIYKFMIVINNKIMKNRAQIIRTLSTVKNSRIDEYVVVQQFFDASAIVSHSLDLQSQMKQKEIYQQNTIYQKFQHQSMISQKKENQTSNDYKYKNSKQQSNIDMIDAMQSLKKKVRFKKKKTKSDIKKKQK